jgi:putative SOS response-associated peptidase YedK
MAVEKYGGRRMDRPVSHFTFPKAAANDVVRPIHAKEMPLLLTTVDGWDTWFMGSVDEAVALQKQLPNEMLRLVATGETKRPSAG